MEKRHKDTGKLLDIMVSLIFEEPLPAKCRPHNLSVNWANFTECHIEGDWVVIYRYDEERIGFAATGTHSDLF
jgi:mRNA interferase YafQ